ncbi:hypothetical protein L227DRAFT_577757 [Lentinus tigrinus ALCF2SS1-6]|uniref:Uncharacterized protein n=1 Tax=Lentinus tigrinus ALCF2SS1-6 TaxID=1328759 RepID=A0A5C2S2T9_9APHY|nr:hypothetical protein L227DRAFT_577757 [Lentinus tigrinus ALCF2SS1-6]
MDEIGLKYRVFIPLLLYSTVLPPPVFIYTCISLHIIPAYASASTCLKVRTRCTRYTRLWKFSRCGCAAVLVALQLIPY